MSKHFLLSHKRPREEESNTHNCEEESNTHNYEEESNTHNCEEETKQIKLTDLPTDLLRLFMFKTPQLRFVSSELFKKSKGWKLPAGAQYPSLTNKDMMCITHIQNFFSGQVMLPCPEKYFYDRRYQIHNGKDPYNIKHMEIVMCFHCLENKPFSKKPFLKRVKPLSGNYVTVISCCSKKCNDALNTIIQLTDVKKLKNRKIKIPSLGEFYRDVEFNLASVIPQSDGKILSYYFQGALVNYQKISVWTSFYQINNYISTYINELE